MVPCAKPSLNGPVRAQDFCCQRVHCQISMSRAKQLPQAAPRPVPWSGQGCTNRAPSVHFSSRDVHHETQRLDPNVLTRFALHLQMFTPDVGTDGCHKATWTSPITADST